jgi:Zn-dependent peptidase ImmA (M78 family)
MTVSVQPSVLKWARERAALSLAELSTQLGTTTKPAPLAEWEQSGCMPLKTLEKFAQRTHVPFGYLFLDAPPVETLPTVDFRSAGNSSISVDLRDTIMACQRRQTWYREFIIENELDGWSKTYVATTDEDTLVVTKRIRDASQWFPKPDRQKQTHGQFLATLTSAVEKLGILVMRNGIVESNTRRKLDHSEFRGFALYDPIAPIIFVNSTDHPAAQIFTLGHELVHIWLRQSALDDIDLMSVQKTERFCNQVAAELLVPMDAFENVWMQNEATESNVMRAATTFGVSHSVVLIRAFDAGFITQAELTTGLDEATSFSEATLKTGGGNYYYMLRSRLGRPFLEAVIHSARSGSTLMRDAYGLLGIQKHSTFVGLEALVAGESK